MSLALNVNLCLFDILFMRCDGKFMITIYKRILKTLWQSLRKCHSIQFLKKRVNHYNRAPTEAEYSHFVVLLFLKPSIYVIHLYNHVLKVCLSSLFKLLMANFLSNKFQGYFIWMAAKLDVVVFAAFINFPLENTLFRSWWMRS